MVLVLVAAALLVVAFVPTAWAEATACSDTANVGWSVDHATVTVTGVHVQVPGCGDGEWVGIELVTDAGDVPADGPLTSEVTDEVANFGISELELRVEPVTGIRVFLLLDGEPVPVIVVTVEQRFFASSGREQVGLIQTTDLQITTGSRYRVPPAPTGYADVSCDDMRFELPTGMIGQGPGEFAANEPGTHVACYQIAPGTPGGPGPGGPSVDEPEVLGVTIEAADEPAQSPGESDDGSASERLTESGLESLARTGFNSLGIFLVGIGLVVAGGSLTRRRRARS